MENCRRRQSSSTSVLLPTGSSGNGMTVQQESIPGRESCGRDIRITFTIQDTSLGPLKRGLGDDDFFNCSTAREAVVCLYTRSVSMQIDDNLALLCAGQNRHGVENERVSQERSSDPS